MLQVPTGANRNQRFPVPHLDNQFLLLCPGTAASGYDTRACVCGQSDAGRNRQAVKQETKVSLQLSTYIHPDFMCPSVRLSVCSFSFVCMLVLLPVSLSYKLCQVSKHMHVYVCEMDRRVAKRAKVRRGKHLRTTD